MSLNRIHLHKLLKIFFLEPKACRSALRTDIREEIAKEAGQTSSGGDFYAPFWSDAKDHVFGIDDLRVMVANRIVANPRRTNLYPRLRNGFLLWWNERRRWTNEPFRPGQPVKAQIQFPGLETFVKVDNMLSVRDGLDAERVVYPYFAPEPSFVIGRGSSIGPLAADKGVTEYPTPRIQDFGRNQRAHLFARPQSFGRQ